MWSVYYHWVLIHALTVLVAFLNSYFLIRHITFCASCTDNSYIKNTANKDVKAMAATFMALGILVAVASFISKFKKFSRYGFASRTNAVRYNDIFIVLLYVAILYNIFSFMNFAAVASKCRSSSRCKARKRELEKHRNDWRMAKTLNVIYIVVGASYIIYRFTCPRQRYGVPSAAMCKRILCRNKIRSNKDLEKFESVVKKVEEADENDWSKKARLLVQNRGLKRENGDSVRGDQLGYYDEVVHQIRACASAKNERIELLGFKSDSWAQSCSGIESKKKSTSSSSRPGRYNIFSQDKEKLKREEQRKKDKEREKQMIEFDRKMRKRMREKEKEQQREKEKAKSIE